MPFALIAVAIYCMLRCANLLIILSIPYASSLLVASHTIPFSFCLALKTNMKILGTDHIGKGKI